MAHAEAFNLIHRRIARREQGPPTNRSPGTSRERFCCAPKLSIGYPAPPAFGNARCSDMVLGLGLNFDLLDQLSFYGAYHRHPVNKAIHLVFVPCIIWSALVWMAGYVPEAAEGVSLAGAFRAIGVPRFLASAAVPNLGALALIAYSAYYVALEPIAGTSWFVMCGLPMWLSASWFESAVGWDAAWRWALALHVLAWYAQIHPGHVVFEKRRPALLDSLAQSLVLAPLFVWMEVLFACGYRPGLRSDVDRRVKRAVEERERGGAKDD